MSSQAERPNTEIDLTKPSNRAERLFVSADALAGTDWGESDELVEITLANSLSHWSLVEDEDGPKLVRVFDPTFEKSTSRLCDELVGCAAGQRRLLKRVCFDQDRDRTTVEVRPDHDTDGFSADNLAGAMMLEIELIQRGLVTD